MVKERGMTVAEFSRRISTHRRNVYDIFKRRNVDTALLLKIGAVLEYNFFRLYGEVSYDPDVLTEPDGKGNYNRDQTGKLRRRIETLETENRLLLERLKDKETIIELLKKSREK